jgi:hypothetical protein
MIDSDVIFCFIGLFQMIKMLCPPEIRLAPLLRLIVI